MRRPDFYTSAAPLAFLVGLVWVFLIIVPVLMYGLGAMSLGPWAWWVLGALILLGSKLIWFVTEWLWGRYTPGR